MCAHMWVHSYLQYECGCECACLCKCAAGHLFELSTHPSWHLRLNSLFECVCGLICWFVLHTHSNIHTYIHLLQHNIWWISETKHKVTISPHSLTISIHSSLISQTYIYLYSAIHCSAPFGQTNKYVGRRRFMSCELCECTTTLTIYFYTLQSGTR